MFLKKAISGGCRGENRRARSLCKELRPREVKRRVVSAHWRRPLLAAEGMLPAQPQGPDVERSVRVPLTSFSALVFSSAYLKSASPKTAHSVFASWTPTRLCQLPPHSPPQPLLLLCCLSVLWTLALPLEMGPYCSCVGWITASWLLSLSLPPVFSIRIFV